MEFMFERFVESWAAHYKPMRHDRERNPRFFICDSYFSMKEWMQHMKACQSPIVIIESDMAGRIGQGVDYPAYTAYFLVQAAEMGDGTESIRAKRRAKGVMQDFVNALRAFRDASPQNADRLAIRPGSYLQELRAAVFDMGDQCLANIGIDDLDYQTVNEIYDGWMGITVTITDMVPVNLCVDGSRYE